MVTVYQPIPAHTVVYLAEEFRQGLLLAKRLEFNEEDLPREYHSEISLGSYRAFYKHVCASVNSKDLEYEAFQAVLAGLRIVVSVKYMQVNPIKGPGVVMISMTHGHGPEIRAALPRQYIQTVDTVVEKPSFRLIDGSEVAGLPDALVDLIVEKNIPLATIPPEKRTPNSGGGRGSGSGRKTGGGPGTKSA